MAQGCVIVNLMLLCLMLCIDNKFQGVNAQNVTLSKAQPIDDPEEGATVKLRCNATNLESGDFIEWSRLVVHTNVVIRSALGITKYSLYTESSSEDTVVEILTINGVQKDDVGIYYCKVKHSEGTVVAGSVIYLTVLYLPSEDYPLCSPNGPFTVQEGTTQQFTCASEKGSPSVSMLIMKNDVIFSSWISPSGTNNSFLTISSTLNFTADDNGTFVECKIIYLPSFQRSCTFGPITVIMQDNRESQLPTTVENRPTPQTDATSEGSDTSYPTWTETTIDFRQRSPHPSTPSQDTSNPSTKRQGTSTPPTSRQETSNASTPSQETPNPSTPSQDTPNPSTPSQDTSNPFIPSQKTSNPSTPNLPVTYLPIVIIVVVVVGFLCLLLILILVVCWCCVKKKSKPRQPQVNLPLFQPTTDLVFEPQGSYPVIHKVSTNLDKADMSEKDDTPEEICADQNPKPDVMLVSHPSNAEPEDKQSSSFKNGTGPSPTYVDKKNINTFVPQPGLTADTADSKEGQGEIVEGQEDVLLDEPHKPTPMTGEVVYSDVSSQQRVPQVSSGYTTYADLDLSPCTSDTVPLPKDQTLYAMINNK